MSLQPHSIPAEWLSAYYDGELDAARTAQVEAHLPTCAACQHALTELSLLSDTLEADALPAEAELDPAAFWQKLEPQLPSQPPAAAAVEVGQALRRWLPGLGLLLVNGLVQVVGGLVAVWLWLTPQVSAGSNWVNALGNFVIGSVLGLPAWLLPGSWLDLGVTLVFVTFSACLAVLYVAWLGYELRYGPTALARVSAA